jgi:ketosteroid isomerase-like protein
MQTDPKEIVQTLLKSVHDPDTVKELCAPDVTYVSLNYANADLHKIMPWCGTSHGPEAILKTFRDVAQFWTVDSFTPEEIFGEAGNVAVFGRFTYTSTKLQKTITSPFSILCRVKDGKIGRIRTDLRQQRERDKRQPPHLYVGRGRKRHHSRYCGPNL